MQDQEVEKIIEVISNGGSQKNGGASANAGIFKTVTAVAVLATLVFMARGEFAPLRQRILGAEDNMHRTEQRIEAQITAVDKKIQIEVTAARDAADLEAQRTKARLRKLEEWQVWWTRNVPRIDAKQDAQIEALERDMYGTPILIPKQQAPKAEIIP